MWEFVMGLCLGLAIATVYAKTAEAKLCQQRNAYEVGIQEARDQAHQLSLEDAYRSGRDFEAQLQKQEKDKLRRRVDELMQANDELVSQLGNANAFATAWNTGRKAVVHIGQR